MKQNLIPKLSIVFLSIAAIVTLFFPWVKIDVPFVGSVYRINGIQAIGYVPLILLSLTVVAFSFFSFMSVKRIVSIGAASLNVMAVVVMLADFSRVKNNDEILKNLGNISIIDNLFKTQLSSIVDSCIKYENVPVLTISFVVIAFIISFFINDKY